MVDLLRADFLKTRKRAMGWAMLAIGVAMVALILVLSAFDPSQDEPKMSLVFPGGMLMGAQVLSQLGGLMMVIFGATLVGTEYGFDTWKNLLTRRSGRAAFIFSKWITMALAVLIATLVLPLWSQALGLTVGTLLQQTATAAVPLGVVLLQIGMSALAPLVAGAFGMLGAVIGRSSVSGIIVGIAWLLADAALGQFLPGVSKLASFSVAQGSLAMNLSGADAPFGLPVSLLAIALYLFVPVGVAVYLFRKRDMV
jgi:ABC-type transport system involved in multi-copper enzyme maturation permease subunit